MQIKTSETGSIAPPGVTAAVSARHRVRLPWRARDHHPAPAQPLLFPECLLLTRIRPADNERRYYRLEIVTDLFGKVGVARTWGRIGRSAPARLDPQPDLGTALDTLITLARARRRRGYQDHQDDRSVQADHAPAAASYPQQA